MKLFKYQWLIDEVEARDCPSAQLTGKDIKAYRWCHSPIEHELNFLPNFLYQRKRNKVPRVHSPQDLCNNCNLSFFVSAEIAVEKLTGIKTRLEKKHAQLIDFYTHVCEGLIESGDGLVTEVENHHFMLFEYVNCELKDKFSII